MEEQTGSFKAKDSNGKEVIVYVYMQFILTEDRGGKTWRENSRILRTAEGEQVSPQEDGTYETGGWPPMILTSDDPNAVRLTS